MQPLTGTLILVGAGKMGGAMAEGWLRGGLPGNQLTILDPHIDQALAARLHAQGAHINPALAAVSGAEVLLFAVKPQALDEVLKSWHGKLNLKGRPLIISILAGRPIRAFEQHFGEGVSVIRAMPNTPAAIGRGITAITGNAHVGERELQLASSLLSGLGAVVEVADETDIDRVTAVSGSGPAYVFYMMEALTQAAVDIGVKPALASQLALATISGAAELMRVSGQEAEDLRRNVTSPKGTTEAALGELMHAETGLKPLLHRTVEAAFKRAQELGRT